MDSEPRVYELGAPDTVPNSHIDDHPHTAGTNHTVGKHDNVHDSLLKATSHGNESKGLSAGVQDKNDDGSDRLGSVNIPTSSNDPLGSIDASPEVVFGPSSAKRPRGRPKGSKDTKPRKKRGPNKNKNSPEAKAAAAQDFVSFLSMMDEHAEDQFAHFAMDDGEELVEAEVFLSYECEPGQNEKPARAFHPNNPYRPKWVESKDKEQTRLESYKAWRKLTDEEELRWRRGQLQAVPCALLLNRKRCGRYKSRLVVLGDRWRQPSSDNSVYASVVSQTGNRVAMTFAAREGFTPIPFDTQNAFVQAQMDREVAITLPPSFRDDDDDSGRRMLCKALYGLPVSPRLWAKTLAATLSKLGWVECKYEPGVWVKRDDKGKVIGILTVYVDDCVLCAAAPELAEEECAKIHKHHELTKIATTTNADGALCLDLLGADIEFNAKARTLKLSMKNFINKLLKRFDLQEMKPRPHPGFPEQQLYSKASSPSGFAYRGCVGALQWLSSVARPDLAHATNVLARASSQPVTKAMANMCKLVLRYVIATKDLGIMYSPELEAEYQAKFESLVEHADNKNAVNSAQAAAPVHTFTDASFGVTYREMRSVSGVGIFLFGTPVAWKTKVQTVFAISTTESEWIALSDGIELGVGVQSLAEFLIGKEKSPKGPLWCDNRGAVISGRKGIKNTEEIPKRTRHVALRFAKVLTEAERLWFCPTDYQKADGLTKSVNPFALKHIFINHPPPSSKYVDESELGDEEEVVNYYHVYQAMIDDE